VFEGWKEKDLGRETCKFCQIFKIKQPKVINCLSSSDFSLVDFKFLTEMKFKTG
jgi:hypothetical protein